MGARAVPEPADESLALEAAGSWPPPLPSSRDLHGSVHGYYRVREEKHWTDVHVVVLAGESGEPIRDAVVEVFRPGEPVRSLRTDRRGATSFAGGPGGMADIHVDAPGRVPLTRRDVRLPAGAEVDVHVRLEPGVVMEGLVRSEHGPIADARIRLWLRDPWWAVWPHHPFPAPLLEASTDRRGRFRLDALPRLTDVVLVIQAEGRAVYPDTFAAGADPERVLRRTFELPRAVTLRGQVVDREERPVAGVAVFVVPSWATNGDWRTTPPDVDPKKWERILIADFALDLIEEADAAVVLALRAFSGEDGTFEIEGLPAGASVWLLATDPVGGLGFGGARGGVVDGPLRLQGRTAVNFEVRDSLGRPVLEARIRAAWAGHPVQVSPLEPGRFGTAHLPAGPVAVDIDSPAHPLFRYAGALSRGASNLVRAVLADGSFVTGRVVNDERRPVAGATVSLDSKSGVTDGTGRFSVRDANPDWRVLAVEKEGHVPIQRSRTFGRTEESMDLVLHRALSVTALLVPPRGGPVPRYVHFVAHGEENARTEQWDLEWEGGRVEFTDASVRAGGLLIEAEGYVSILREHEPGDSEPVRLGRIELQVPTELAGEVVSAEGRPIPGLQVEIRPADPPVPRDLLPPVVTVTDSSGRLRVRVPFPGRVEARFLPEAGPPWSASIAEDWARRAVELVRPPVVTVHGTLVSAHGTPAPGVALRIVPLDAPEGAVSTGTDAEGRFSVEFLAVDFRVYATVDGEMVVLQRRVAAGGAEVPLQLELPRAR